MKIGRCRLLLINTIMLVGILDSVLAQRRNVPQNFNNNNLFRQNNNNQRWRPGNRRQNNMALNQLRNQRRNGLLNTRLRQPNSAPAMNVLGGTEQQALNTMSPLQNNGQNLVTNRFSGQQSNLNVLRNRGLNQLRNTNQRAGTLNNNLRPMQRNSLNRNLNLRTTSLPNLAQNDLLQRNSLLLGQNRNLNRLNTQNRAPQTQNMNNLRKIGNNVMNRQQNLRNMNQQTNLNGMNQHQNLNGMNQQQNLNGMNQQQNFNEITQKQQVLNGINQQQNLNGMNQQQNLNGMNQQQNLNGMNQQQNLNAIDQQQQGLNGMNQQQQGFIGMNKQQQNLNGMNQQQGFNGINQQQQDFNGMNQQQEPNGINQQQGLSGMNQQQNLSETKQQQQGLNGINQKQQGLNGSYQQQQSLNGINQQQQGLNAVKRQQGPDGINRQQQSLGGMNTQQQGLNGMKRQQEGFNAMNRQQQNLNGMNQQQGFMNQQQDLMNQQQDLINMNRQQDINGINQQQGLNAINQQQDPTGVNQQQGLNDMNKQQQGLDDMNKQQQGLNGMNQQQQGPTGINLHQQNLNNMNSQQGLTGMNQRQGLSGMNQKQALKGMNQRQGLSGMNRQQQDLRGMNQQQDLGGMNQQQGLKGMDQQQDLNGLNRQQVFNDMNQQQIFKDMNQQQDPKSMSQHQGLNGMNQQQQGLGGMNQQHGLNSMNQQRDINGMSQQQDPNVMNQSQNTNITNQQQNLNGMNQQRDDLSGMIQQQDPNGMNQQENLNVMNQRKQNLNDMNQQQQVTTGTSQQQQNLIGMNEQQQGINGMNQEQQGFNGINQLQNLNGMNQPQQELNGINRQQQVLNGINRQQQALNGMNQRKGLDGINQQQNLNNMKSQQGLIGMKQQQQDINGMNQQQQNLIGMNQRQNEFNGLNQQQDLQVMNQEPKQGNRMVQQRSQRQNQRERIAEMAVEQRGLNQQMEQFSNNRGQNNDPNTFQDPQMASDTVQEFPIGPSRYPLDTSVVNNSQLTQNKNLQKPSDTQLSGSATGNLLDVRFENGGTKDKPISLSNNPSRTPENVQVNIGNRAPPVNRLDNAFDSANSQVKDSISFPSSRDAVGSQIPNLPEKTSLAREAVRTLTLDQSANGAGLKNVVESLQPAGPRDNTTLESKASVQETKTAPIEIMVIDPNQINRLSNRADPNGRYREMYMPVQNGPRELQPFVHNPYYQGPAMTEYDMMSRFEFFHPGGGNTSPNLSSKDAKATKKRVAEAQGSQPARDSFQRGPLATSAPELTSLPVDTPKLRSPERPSFDPRSAEARSQNGYIEITSKADLRPSSKINTQDLPGKPQRKVFIKSGKQEKRPQLQTVNIDARPKITDARNPIDVLHQTERQRPVGEPMIDSRGIQEHYQSQWRHTQTSPKQKDLAQADPKIASAKSNPDLQAATDRLQNTPVESQSPQTFQETQRERLNFPGTQERHRYQELKKESPKDLLLDSAMKKNPSAPKSPAPVYPERPRQQWERYDPPTRNAGTASATGNKPSSRGIQSTAVPYEIFIATTPRPTAQAFHQPIIPDISVNKDLSNPSTILDPKLPGYTEGGYTDAFGHFYPFQTNKVASPKSIQASLPQVNTNTVPDQASSKIQPKALETFTSEPSSTSKPAVPTQTPAPIPVKIEKPTNVQTGRDPGHHNVGLQHQNGRSPHHNGAPEHINRDRFHHNRGPGHHTRGQGHHSGGPGHHNMGPPHDPHNHHAGGPPHMQGGQPPFHGPHDYRGPGYYPEPPPNGQYHPYDQPPRYDYPPPPDRNMHNQQPYDPAMNPHGPGGMAPPGSNNQPGPYADPYAQAMSPSNSYNQQPGGYNQQYPNYGPPVDQYQNPPYHYQGGSHFADPHFLGIGRWDRTMPRSSRKRARTSNKASRPPSGGLRGRGPPARPAMHGMMPRNSPPVPGSPGFMHWMKKMDAMGIDTMFEMPDSTDPTLPPSTIPPPTYRPALLPGMSAVSKLAARPAVKEVILPGSISLVSTVSPPHVTIMDVKTSTSSPVAASSKNSSQANLKKASLKELLLTMTKWALQASDKISQAPVWIQETTTTTRPTTLAPTTTTTTTTVPTTQTTDVTTPKAPKKPKEPSFAMLASPDVLHKYFRHDRLPLVMNKFTPPPTVPKTTQHLTTGARTTRVILLNVHKPALRAHQTLQGPPSSQYHKEGQHAQGLGHSQYHGGLHMKRPESRQGLAHDHHQASYHVNQPERVPYPPGQSRQPDQRRIQPMDRLKVTFKTQPEPNYQNSYQNMHNTGNYQHPKDPNMPYGPQQVIPASQHHVPSQYDVNTSSPYNYHPGRNQAPGIPYEGSQVSVSVGANKPNEPIHKSVINNGPHVNSNQPRYSNNHAPAVPYDVHQSGPTSRVNQPNQPHLTSVNGNGPYIGNLSPNAPLDSQRGAPRPQASDPNQNVANITGSNMHDPSHLTPNVPNAIQANSQPSAPKQNSVDGKGSFNYIDIPLDGKMDIQSLLKKLMTMNNPTAVDQTNIEFATGTKVYQHPSSNESPIDQPVNAPAAVNGQQNIQKDIKITSTQETSLTQPKKEQTQINPVLSAREVGPVNDTIHKPSNETNANPRPPAHGENHIRPQYTPYYHSQNQYDATANAQGVPSGGQAVPTGNEYHPHMQGQYQYHNVPDPRAPDAPGRPDLYRVHSANNMTEPIHKNPGKPVTNSGSEANDNATNAEFHPKPNGQNSNPKQLIPGGSPHGQYPQNHYDSIPKQDIPVGPIDGHPSGQIPPQASGPGNVHNYPNPRENAPHEHVQSGAPGGQLNEQNSTKPRSKIEPPVNQQLRGHGAHFDSRGRPNYDPNIPRPHVDGYPTWQRPRHQNLPPNMQLKSGFFSYPHETNPKPSGRSSHEPFHKPAGASLQHQEGAYPQQNGLRPHEPYPGAALKHQEGAYPQPHVFGPHEPYPKPPGAAPKHQEGAYQHPNGLNPQEPYPGAAAKHQEGGHPRGLGHEPYPKPPGAAPKHQEGAYPHPNGFNPNDPYPGAASKYQEVAYQHPNDPNPQEPNPGAAAKHQGGRPQPHDLGHEPYPKPSGYVPHGAPQEAYSGHHHGPRGPPAQYYPRGHEGHQNGAFPQAESHRPPYHSGPHFGPEFYPPGSHYPEARPRYNPYDIIHTGHQETTSKAESTTASMPVTDTTTTVPPTATTAPKNNGPSSFADINKRIAELMKQIQKLNKVPDATAPLDSVASVALHPASPNLSLIQRAPAQSTNQQGNGQAEQPNFEEIIRDINNHRQENGLGGGDVNKVGEHIILENSEGMNPAGESQPANLPKEQQGLIQTYNELNGLVQRHPGDLLNTTPQPTQPNFATVHSKPDPHVVVWNGEQNQAVPNAKTLKAIRQHLISHSKSLWDMHQKTNAEILKKTEVLNHDSTILTRPYTVVEPGKIKNINSAVLNDYILKLMNNQTKSRSTSASTMTHAQNAKGVATSGVHTSSGKKVLIKIPKLMNPSASSLIHKIIQQGHLNVETSSVVSNSSEAAPYQIHVPQPPPGTPIQNVFQIIIPGSENDVSTESPSETITTTEEPLTTPTTDTPEVTTPVDPEAAGEQAMMNSNAEFYNYYYYEDD